MKKKSRNIFVILLLVFLFVYFLITAILDLTNKKDLHTINLAGAFEILEVEHSIYGLIPVGKEHYYIGIEEDSYNAYIIKASKIWFKNHFDSDYMAKDAGGIRITALAGDVQDYKISEELQSRAEKIEELNYPLGTEHCLNMAYKVNAIMKLIVVALCVILPITFALFVKPNGDANPLFSKCWFAGLIIAVILLIICLR